MPRRGKGSKHKPKPEQEPKKRESASVEFVDNGPASDKEAMLARILTSSSKEIATIERAFWGGMGALGFEDDLYYDEHYNLPNPNSLLIEKDTSTSYNNLWQLYRYMAQDGIISSCLQTRYNALVGLDWDIVPGGPDNIDLEIADFCKTVLNNVINLDLTREHITGTAISYGFSVTEQIPLILEEKPWRNKIGVRFERRPNGWFEFDAKERLRFLSKDKPTQGELVPPKHFIVSKYKPEPLNPYGNGVLAKCFWAWLAKRFGSKWRLIFLERFGIPMLVGQYEDIADQPLLKQALLNAMQDAVVTIPKGTDITVPPVDRRSSGDVFQSHTNYESDVLRLVILGQTLTSKDVGTGGSYAQAKVHDEVREDYKEADVKMEQRVFREQFIKPVVEINYNRRSFTDFPKFIVNYQKPFNRKEVAETLKLVTVDIGLPVDDKVLYDELRLPVPIAPEGASQELEQPDKTLDDTETESSPEDKDAFAENISRKKKLVV